MSFKNNTCPHCATSLTDADVARIRRREWKVGSFWAFIGLVCAGLGVYFGANA